nr:hypothetical protein SPACI_40990 [Sporomusa acidovorans DSM 3132]
MVDIPAGCGDGSRLAGVGVCAAVVDCRPGFGEVAGGDVVASGTYCAGGSKIQVTAGADGAVATEAGGQGAGGLHGLR